jgi:hypothetical protein
MITTAEYQEFLVFINVILRKTRLKGTIQAGDIANTIFIAHPKMALAGLKTFVKKCLNKAVTDEQNSRLCAKALRQKHEEAGHWLTDEKANNPIYTGICNDRNNSWEKKQRKHHTRWTKRRNKTQKLRKRQQKKDRDNLLPPL